MSKLEATLALHIKALKLPEPVREHRFHPSRQWRFDFAWPELKLAAEVEGGTESHGQKRRVSGKTITIKSRHLTPSGFREDCKKYNEAARLGWRVLRFSGAMVNKGEAVQAIKETLGNNGYFTRDSRSNRHRISSKTRSKHGRCACICTS